MRDGHRDGQRARPLQCAPDQVGDDLRVRREPHPERAVEPRHHYRLDDHQNRVEGQRRVVALVLGRAQHVAWAEQLGAEAPVAADAADEEALEQQQADPAVCRLGRFVRDPRGARHAHDARNQIAPGGLQAAAVEPVRQIGVVDEDVAHQSRHPSDVRVGAASPPVAPGVWGARSHAEARAGDDRRWTSGSRSPSRSPSR